MKKTKKIFSLLVTVILIHLLVIGIYADSIFISGNGNIIIEREIVSVGIVSQDELLPLASGTCYPSQNAAMRAAKSSVNIPYSQNYISMQQVWMEGANGQMYAAILEVYPGNKYIRNDSQGHKFSDGQTMARHYNSGTIGSDGQLISSGKHFWY